MRVEDAECYAKWFNDFNVTDYLDSRSSTIITEKAEADWLENAIKESKCILGIVRLADDKLIGNCAIESINNISGTGTLGIFIGDNEDRENGYGTEAVRLMVDYGFNYLNLKNIMLWVADFNERAKNTYKKVGFKEAGRRRKACFVNGKYYDKVMMDILSEEFNESYIKNKNI
jgi:RimJ/RimL family protein N-acetyltransferase